MDQMEMAQMNRMILGENQIYSLDCYETQMNNNVLVVGANRIIGLSQMTFRKQRVRTT